MAKAEIIDLLNEVISGIEEVADENPQYEDELSEMHEGLEKWVRWFEEREDLD